MDIKKRLLRTALLSLIGLGIGVGIAAYQISQEPALTITAKDQSSTSTQSSMAGVSLGGPFTLRDHTGAAVTQDTYKGDYKLIYFGFTYCPAICPTELQKISGVMKSLPEEISTQIQPLFITVDPDRDTVPVMADYVDLFHPKLIGLTGTPDQIEAVKKQYRVFATKVETEEMSDYTVDHSSFIYFMGPDDTLLSIYRIKDTQEYITEDIRRVMDPANAQ